MSHATATLPSSQPSRRPRHRVPGKQTLRRAIHLGARAAIHEEEVRVEDRHDEDGYRCEWVAGDDLEAAIRDLGPVEGGRHLYDVAWSVRERYRQPVAEITAAERNLRLLTLRREIRQMQLQARGRLPLTSTERAQAAQVEVRA
jgi:hypothetical protein